MEGTVGLRSQQLAGSASIATFMSLVILVVALLLSGWQRAVARRDAT